MSNFFVFKIPQAKAGFIVPSGQLFGIVTNSQTGQGLANVDLKLLDTTFNMGECPSEIPSEYYCENGYMGWQTDSNSEGNYLFPFIEFSCDMAEGLNLTTSLYGYEIQTIKDINVPCYGSLELNVELTPVPFWRLDIQPGDVVYDPYTSGVGHTALYIGNGKTIEATSHPDHPHDPFKGLVRENDIVYWDYPSRKNVYLLRVKKPEGLSDEAMELIRNNAVEFVKFQAALAKPYDWGWYKKDPSQDAESWYCSELVWAAYYNQGIDLEYSHDPLGIVSPISPAEIFLDDDTYVVNSHIEYQGGWRDYVFLMILSPVEVTVVDPAGNILTKDNPGIPDAIYLEDYVDPQTDQVYDMISLPNIAGDYQITVMPKLGADPNETYSLIIKVGDQETVLAQDVKISEIPATPYIISGSLSGSGTGGFSDTETSLENTYSVGTLDTVLSSANDFAPAVTPSQFAMTSAMAQNNGTLDFQYKIRVENFSGDTDLCEQLNLSDFNSATTTLLTGTSDNLNFIANLLSSDLSLQNKTCHFDFVLTSWQTDLPAENQGFFDVEVISNTIESGSWDEEDNMADYVVISEILPDPDGDDDQYEWFELYNPTGEAIDITGWSFGRITSGGIEYLDGTITSDTTIAAHSFYLIGDSLSITPAPDLIESLIITNNNGSYWLKDANGNFMDKVSWGNNNYGEGLPFTPNPSEGKSLERKSGATHNETQGNGYDTNDNANDFILRDVPEPQNSSEPPEP